MADFQKRNSVFDWLALDVVSDVSSDGLIGMTLKPVLVIVFYNFQRTVGFPRRIRSFYFILRVTGRKVGVEKAR